MRVSILWAGLASYSVALYRQLAEAEGCRIQLIHQPAPATAPYRDFDLAFCEYVIVDGPEVRRTLLTQVEQFGPDWILMASWNYPHFMRIAKSQKKKGTFVLSGMDNQWRATTRQFGGVVASRFYLKPAISTFLVAGDRQAEFARRLGYNDVLYGLYAADVKTFAAVAASGARPRCFLYVGRLVQEKGIANLIDGYSIYRSSSTKPWDLIVVGTGPMADRVTNVPGVKYLGFIEPNALPAVFRDAGCLLLPSLWEPWGVVVHEAAAAGLPVICTHACGASTAFVRDGMNGAVIATTASALATALTEFTGKTAEERNAMSAYGRALAALWTPAMEAKYLVSSVRSRLGRSVGAVSASPQR